MDIETIVKIAPTVVALVAVIVSPVVSFFITKKQLLSAQSIADINIKTNVLSKNRQDWINNLRNEISGYVSKVNMVLPLFVSVKDSNQMHALVSDISNHSIKIKLYINPNERDHMELITKIDEISSYVFNFKGMPTSLTEEIITISQKILKREWERVKAVR